MIIDSKLVEVYSRGQKVWRKKIKKPYLTMTRTLGEVFMVKKLWEKGKSNSEIAELTDIPLRTVQRFTKALREEGDIAFAQPTGRPRKTELGNGARWGIMGEYSIFR